MAQQFAVHNNGSDWDMLWLNMLLSGPPCKQGHSGYSGSVDLLSTTVVKLPLLLHSGWNIAC
jgi:hypothetical protein